MNDHDRLGETTIAGYLERLSSAEPTPGGGSAASLVASLAASLGLMVVAVGRKRGDDPTLAKIGGQLHRLRRTFLGLACEDEEAFGRVLTAYRLPKTDPNRSERIEAALAKAAGVPLRMAAECVELLRRLAELAPLAPRQIASDLGAACHLARGAIDSALLNVTVNIAYMHGQEAIADLASERDRLAALGGRLAERVGSLVAERIG